MFGKKAVLAGLAGTAPVVGVAAAALVLVSGLLALPVAFATTEARQLQMARSNTQFASFTCLNPPSCSLTQLGLVADATINLCPSVRALVT